MQINSIIMYCNRMEFIFSVSVPRSFLRLDVYKRVCTCDYVYMHAYMQLCTQVCLYVQSMAASSFVCSKINILPFPFGKSWTYVTKHFTIASACVFFPKPLFKSANRRDINSLHC